MTNNKRSFSVMISHFLSPKRIPKTTKKQDDYNKLVANFKSKIKSF